MRPKEVEARSAHEGALKKTVHDTPNSVWFNAWKYEGKEVVWNALIQSIFFEMIKVADDPKTKDENFLKDVGAAAKNLALFAARKWTSTVTAGVFDGEDVDKVIEALRPLTAQDPLFTFINTFEAEFARLVNRFVGDTGRIIVFVDDLDRCLPENAVEVLEAIKLYLDSEKVTFVIGVEPEVIREGIRMRYKDNAVLAEREYLEKIIQLPFVMRGIGRSKADALIQTHSETAGFVANTMMLQLIAMGTQLNPRRIKRFLNSMHVASRMAPEDPDTDPVEDMWRLGLVLLIQIRFRTFYEDLARAPELLGLLQRGLNFADEDKSKLILDHPALGPMLKDQEAWNFVEAARNLDCSPAKINRWVRLVDSQTRDDDSG